MGRLTDGPTVFENDGIGLLAPGAHIVSAKADGEATSMNGDWRGSSGTSMATPMAAAAAGVVQQMIEQGWLHGGSTSEASLNLSATAPLWANPAQAGMAWVAEGWTPSGPMLRATLALSAEPLPAAHANDGAGPAGLSNPHDGWGQPRLERLLSPALVEGAWDMAPHVVLHDAYRLVDTTPVDLLHTRLNEVGATSRLSEAPWNGTGAVGPSSLRESVSCRPLRCSPEATSRCDWPILPSEGRPLTILWCTFTSTTVARPPLALILLVRRC